MRFPELTIVTSCVHYGKYLKDWAQSIGTQSVRPGRVCIFTHGTRQDRAAGGEAVRILNMHGVIADHEHELIPQDFGIARNRAVGMASTEWVMHLDADDMLFPGAIEDVHAITPDADVVQSGYERIGLAAGHKKVKYLYVGADGVNVLALPAIASGNSAFRRSLWEQSPYRTDLFGAWDTILWIGFARLGARFRPSQFPVFQYRYHPDSIFSRRRISKGWDSIHTRIMVQSMRRGDDEATIQRTLEEAMASRRSPRSPLRAWERDASTRRRI